MTDGDHLRQRQATVYNRARRRLSLADTAAGLVGLAAIAIWADSLGGWGCVAALAVALPLISIPFGYSGHVLSRRNGLSRQTMAGWLGDQAKARLIGLTLGGAVVLGLLGCQRLSPDWWALPAWGGAVTLSVALTILWPVLLLPLFVRSEPLAEGELAEELWRTIRASGVAVKELRLLHMGEKTSAANAMVAGLGPTLRVYVGDTIGEGSEAETGIEDTRLVLAHELGHHVTNDVWRLLAWSALALAAGMAGAWASVRWLAPDGPGHLTCLPALMIGFMLASSAISPLGAAYSRRRERAADAYAVSVTGQGERYAETFERLVEQNLMELRPPRLWHTLTASHPMPADRIAAARARG